MKSLKTMLVLILAAITLLIFLAQSALAFTQFKKQVLRDAEQNLLLQAQNKGAELYGLLEKSSKLSEGLTFAVGSSTSKDVAKIEEMTKKFVLADPLIVGGGFWMEPNKFDPKTKLYARYAFKSEKGIEFDDQYSTGTYDYLKEEWYTNGYLGKSSVWSAPYKDAVTGVPMITVTSPIEQDKKVIGVTTIDVGLSELQKQINSMEVGQNGYAFLLASDGAYIAHPDTTKNMDVKITDDSDASVAALGDQILKAGQAGVDVALNQGEKSYISHAPIGNTGMIIVTQMDYSELIKPVNDYLRNSLIVFLLAFIIFVLFVYWFIHRMVSVPIYKLKHEIETLAEKGGDLTQRISIQGKHEVSQLASSFNQFIANLRGIVSNVSNFASQVEHISSSSSQSAVEVDQASDQMAIIVQDIAVGTETQSNSVTDILDKMTSTHLHMQETKSELDKTLENARLSTVIAGNGGQAIQEAMQEVEKISEMTNQTVIGIRKLEESSNRIGEIVTSISAISYSTNLLALNATIEASRAGEHGKGFGVVAGEIRKLAEKSKLSTLQITELVELIQQQTQSSVQMIERNFATMANLTEKTKAGGLALENIEQHVQETDQSIRYLHGTVEQVAENAMHVLSAIEEASAASEQMTASTQEVSANVEEQNASISLLSHNLQEMNKLAKQLRSEVSKFNA